MGRKKDKTRRKSKKSSALLRKINLFVNKYCNFKKSVNQQRSESRLFLSWVSRNRRGLRLSLFQKVQRRRSLNGTEEKALLKYSSAEAEMLGRRAARGERESMAGAG